jgi:hypothetical protein
MLTVAIAMLIGQVLIILVGVGFSVINHLRCKQGKRPIGYGSQATCNDMHTPVDPFYMHPKRRY